MGAEKHGSKSGGGYVGGFLQLFDWNAKSRKKLFSSKSDIPEQPKQKKRCDGNLPVTRVHLHNEDAGSSVKGSSDYSCASSVTDEEYYGIKPAGVVARLMGLDCMPSSTFSEPYSTPFFDSQSLRSAPCLSSNLEYQQNFQTVYSSNLHEKMEALGRSSLEPKHQKIISRPIEKFQSEMLPPKSAKSIPITHCKLLSPIKSANYIPPQNAAHIMEAAARILVAGPHQATSKSKLSLNGSSSAPLKVRDLKERVEASQKIVTKIAEASRRPAESNASKCLKGQPMNKSWNGSADTTTTRQKDFSDSDESFIVGKTKGKSISLALQAKANVQKREGLYQGSSRTVLVEKEPSKGNSNQLFTSQPSTEKNTHKKPSVHYSSSVLRQNNQKQNSIADRGKSPSKQFLSNSQGKRTLSGDSSFTRQRSSGKTAENSKVSSRRLSREADDKKEETYSCTKSVSRKKRPSDGDIQYEKIQAAGSMSTHKSGKLIQSGTFMDREISWGENSKGKGTDIISFTFNAPLTRSVPTPEPPREALGKSHEFSTDFRIKKAPFGHNLSGGDALSSLLDQKLRELSYVVESSRQKTGTSSSSSSIFQDLSPAPNGLLKTTGNHDNMEVDDLVSCCNPGFSSTGQHRHQGFEEELSSEYGSTDRKVFGSRFPSPISVLEHSFLTDSCNSSDTAESNNTGASKQSSSVQAKEVFGIGSRKKFHSMEPDVDLLDSASSTSGKKERSMDPGKSPNWELEYVKDILCNIESMFMDFAVGRSHEIINPHLFDQLERVNGRGHDELKERRKVVFDCVGECLDLRCKEYVKGGYDRWSKGVLVVRNNERLAEEVYREISGWSVMGNCMVDELVEKDMSSYFGRWLDFDVEAFELGIQIEKRLLNSLIDEVVADILVL
ncbi:uncharacterized protein LOC132044522 [Lycium ferocissimum]|uniref:uncharacterized protein LOC132044522 n=1 Tax=Lycium ferocissimum TaxID=112874 RepID=UPI002814E676|nr:uncharacterized protein LOC132044522 [Lycium ferocissimum]XP_059291001.1 uncharacterized protein LOC132044522 [Lycium ferocissimum]XP_059291003.1 uncharacterized protein LOC132044522 [Lycium ferocissimum]XP_059291004.1 uncharacterized protein LOC132044522 [Lycium ferocissimum]XP_059291005.1 uncharacterized protein LOC132044522 [Lycium ferocissimum]XP_059291006.1 uncharacterized protein LOC132044522 [Lycium ferocissimum]